MANKTLELLDKSGDVLAASELLPDSVFEECEAGQVKGLPIKITVQRSGDLCSYRIAGTGYRGPVVVGPCSTAISVFIVNRLEVKEGEIIECDLNTLTIKRTRKRI
jgi:hypothetical protein